MTEYEIRDLASGSMSNFLTTFTIFMSIVTAYIIAAFIAGRRLTGSQLAIVNACFLISSGVIGLLSYLIFRVFLRRAQEADAIVGTKSVLLIDFSWTVAVLYVILTIGSLTFMWNVRRKSDSG